MKKPPKRRKRTKPLTIAKAPSAPPWWRRVDLVDLVSLVGLVATLALATYEAQLHPMPLWRDPLGWLWIVSPFIGWMLAGRVSRTNAWPARIVLVGALVSGLGGLALLAADTFRGHVPGGMNPAAISGSAFTFLAVPLLQWLAVLVTVAMAWVKAPAEGA